MTLWLVRNITRPIQQAVETANRVASLDLTFNIDGHERNEAGRLLNALSRMQASLHALVDQVQDTSHHVAEGATQIAAGQLDVSKRAELTNTFLQQTATSIDEVADAMRVSLQAVDRNETRDTMGRLFASVERMATGMGEIHEGSRIQTSSIASINTAVSQLEQMAQQNAAAMQEAAASARSLQHRASGLRDATNQFRLPSRALTLLPTAS